MIHDDGLYSGPASTATIGRTEGSRIVVDELSSARSSSLRIESSRGPIRSGMLLAVLFIGALFVGLAAGWLIGRAGSDDAPAAPAVTETLDEWKDAVLSEDTSRIVALYSDDAVWHDEALNETLPVSIGWGIFSMIRDVTEVETEAISGDSAVVRWTFEGSSWNLTGLSVLTFDGGEIVAETVYYDCAQSPVASRCANMR